MSTESIILGLNQRLFDAILANDYATYKELCHEVCFTRKCTYIYRIFPLSALLLPFMGQIPIPRGRSFRTFLPSSMDIHSSTGTELL